MSGLEKEKGRKVDGLKRRKEGGREMSDLERTKEGRKRVVLTKRRKEGGRCVVLQEGRVRRKEGCKMIASKNELATRKHDLEYQLLHDS